MKLPEVSSIEWTEVGQSFFKGHPKNLAEQPIDQDLFLKATKDFAFYPTFGGKIWNCHQILPPIGGHSFASLLSNQGYDLSSVLLAGHSYRLYPHDLYGMVYRFADEDRAFYFIKPKAIGSSPDFLCGVMVAVFSYRLPSLRVGRMGSDSSFGKDRTERI